ncbi:SDR family NAD(P)-dependent oxidoreductase [Lysobacter enzymogenes]|uniref:SDR family NAD(P)-dependent oxidoreductase n=1 Tax=Lysobacter enzymogenes TaxID=69 RepID=UPI001A9645BE|nr:SDR family NAD(P)-dependent oxidoreductase [Lysobacter enzymogenes]QQP96966.1 SDR family NAD(P)-dependent oxidoreductase [Lysobacter enzymogenes]
MDFIEFVVDQLKLGRLSREDVLDLIRQFSTRPAGASPRLHPLLHRNASDLHRQCYGSSFDGSEPFLADHQVVADGVAAKVLPGVAYLEMARAAVADALPELEGAQRVRLRDVVWLKPIEVAQRRDVFVVLWAGEGEGEQGALAGFEIISVADGDGDDGAAQETVHCRGEACLADDAPQALDLAALRARMAGGRLDAAAIYPAYRRMGMAFGPAHQAVAQVLQGERELLATLVLPESVRASLSDYRLHPSLLDGALQAAIGLLGDLDELPQRPSLPFALDSLTVWAPCAARMQAWIRPSQGSAAGDKVSRLDIDLCDEDGRLCAQLRGFASRTFHGAVGASAPAGEMVVATPVWRASALPAQAAAFAGEHQVWSCGLDEAAVQALQAQLPTAVCRALPMDADDAATDYAACAQAVLERLKSMLAGLAGKQAFVHLVLADSEAARMQAGLSGLLKSAALEHPGLHAQVLWLAHEASAQALSAQLSAEVRANPEPNVRYRDGVREALAWEELAASAAAPQAFRDNGVYLISGGLGGLGGLFAREILAQTAQARVVLSGRAEASSEIDGRLDALADDAAARARLSYLRLDLADAAHVEAGIAAILAAHGRLDGIVHSAGLVRDGLIAHKRSEDLAEVLAPKVAGSVHLDRASRALDLDFFALFSSGAAAIGNVGQGDYAAANGFLDRYAAHRQALVAVGQRRGRSLAIDWPLWRDGGMRMPAAAQAAMQAGTGMRPMATANGMAAFQRSLAGGAAQTLVIEGEPARIRAAVFGADAQDDAEVADEPSAAVAVVAPAAADAPADRAARLADFLRKQFAEHFKLPYRKIDPRAPFDKYGMDSILAMDLTRQLEKSFGALSKTLFFEHQTLQELTEHLLVAHAATVAKLFAESAPSPAPPVAVAVQARTAVPAARSRGPRSPSPSLPARARAQTGGAQAPTAEPIAIVGLSGRYPQSPDLDAFWRNLSGGVDCVTEVPPERWDWREYYSADRSVDGAHYSKWGGFIEGVDEFDPLFFNIPPVDAEFIDPQERLFLQHAWMAVEDAGYTRAALQIPSDTGLPGEVGVYVGVMYGEYQLFGAEASLQGPRVGVPVSYASIANRVSYLLNLHGPSMTLDSMCSSSLTAIHLACQDLRSGRTALAIAGGVNVSIHPNKYLILSAGQYISGDGHCQSFGEGGDGYIPGEGVGAVVLKRLSEAQRDGNPIYGLLRGSALNHGGRTHGYSVPNPKAQASVIRRALRECGTDARHVSYVEAHGTGTKLGDPIEIAALTDVFRQYTQDRQYCAIGSAKSNIGHCESAAGIAGLTKVLLQMKHAQIAPSLHSAALNPHIDFASSPFEVNQRLRPWDAPTLDGRRLPRIAGISSFGAGGSNAHLIVEEYLAPAQTEPAPHATCVVPLSARTVRQLRQKVADLAAVVERAIDADAAPLDLAALAYTCQLGREPMDARVAFLADSPAALAAKLGAYLRDETGIEDCYSGPAEAGLDSLGALADDEEMQATVERWIARGALARVAELWARGLAVDWSKLHGGRAPRLMSLPAYPFARDRYWIAQPDRSRGQAATRLHPLLHANTSDIYQQRYASRFDGSEFFLADHRIDSGDGVRRKLLPAAAYLEMLRAAAELAVPAEAAPRKLSVHDLIWERPLIVDGANAVSTSLQVGDDGAIEMEIASDAADGAEDEPVVHCRARAQWAPAQAVEALHLAELRARMGGGRLEPAHIYAAFEGMGIHYGGSFRGIAAIARGEAELLAELHVPAAGQGGYALHPALLDCALQACVGLLGDPAALAAPAVPFALDAAEIHGACAARMFAWVRRGEGEGIDIDLCDGAGAVCLRLRGLMLRELRGDERNGALIAQPVWEAAAADAAADAAPGETWVTLCNPDSIAPAQLAAAMPAARIAAWNLPTGNGEPAALADRYRAAALACFAQAQELSARAGGEPVDCQWVVAHDGDDAILAGLAGLLDTLRQEQPQVRAQLLLTEPGLDAETLAAQLRAARGLGDTLLKVEAGRLLARAWNSAALTQAASPESPFKDEGVYLISGGLGGLGKLFAREILAATAAATVVLTGRAEAGAAQHSELQGLSEAWAIAPQRLAYRRLDLADRAAATAAVAAIAVEFGGLNGVIHSAGMLDDGLIRSKSAERFARVLEPKVAGSVHLDLATAGHELDFFVLCSSLAGALGNAGQADYAAANAFMDRYAAQRNAWARAGLRRGHSLSVGWPLWRDGGMHMDEQALAALTRASGMTAMGTDTGLRALAQLLSLRADHALVLEGETARLRRSLQRRAAAPAAPLEAPAPAPAGADGERLLAAAQRWVAGEFASLLKLPAHEVDPKAPLEKYGIDSVLTMKLTQQLERSFGPLSKTLLFEYQTVASLAAYLAGAFAAAMREKTGLGAAAPAPAAAMAPVAAAPARSRVAARMQRAGAFAREAGEDDIAIVGVAGRYPQAADLEQFWDNLRSGRDSVTEVPAERWDHARLFDPQRNRAGKTYSKWGGFLDGVDRFDPLFFSISPREAELMDPQERLFIETVWETLEDAGYAKDGLAQRRVGVYVGAMWGQYELYGVGAEHAGVPSSSFASIANRVSYFFDFHGPSLALDTMCSSSLTAIHLACEDLRKGTVEAAIAGGVNLSLHPSKYLSLSQGNFASSDGRCRSFGADGDGYVPGEGVGAVLLKPLRRALADGDRIHATIKASAINHGGKTNGYTVPNPVAQGQLIRETLQRGGIDAASIGYIETHGTGTSLGDPIEIAGLSRAFAGDGGAPGSCPIGSVKSNIGHLEAAAGIAAVSKVLLQFRHGELAPSLHAQPRNPHIDFDATPFRVQTELQAWARRGDAAHRACVSSFGAGGSNAHLVLEEFRERRIEAAPRPELFLLSAKSREALRTYAAKTVAELERSDAAWADIAFTSQVGRTPMSERLAVVAGDLAGLRQRLRDWLDADGAAAGADIQQGSTRDAAAGAAALIEGEAGAAFLQLVLERRDLERLAKLWIAGVEIDWAQLHRGAQVRRVRLPTYPFSRERYWIRAAAPIDAVATQPAAAAPQPAASQPAAPAQRLHYRSAWRAAPMPSAQADAPIAGPLLLLDAGEALSAELGGRCDGETIAVEFGAGFAESSRNRFTVDPSCDADFDRLAEALEAAGALPRALVHRVAGDGATEAQLERGVFALHALCRALMRRKPGHALRIVALRAGAEAAPAHLALGAYLGSLALEHAKFSGKTLALGADAGDAEIAARVGAELTEPEWRGADVRYTAAGREIRRIERHAAQAATASMSKQDGVYLITGGLGGLGYLFAEHLARSCRARLALSGRSPLDAALEQRLQRLRAHGGEAIYVQADVADPAQAEALAAAARSRFGRIDGVIHSAGVHRDAFALNKDRAAMREVFAAKIHGSENLDRATRADALDAFVLFSSVAGIAGNAGQCDYAYANRFLDGFAEQRQALAAAGERSGRSVSIAWPFWQDGGMRMAEADLALLRARAGIQPLPTEAGLRYWDEFLATDLSHAVAMYGAAPLIDAHLMPSAAARPAAASPAPAIDGADLREASEQYLKGLLSEEIRLPVERIDAQERFEAYGVDSMMIGRLNLALERDLGELPKTLFYQYASIEELAAYLRQDAAAALGRLLMPAAAAAPAQSAAPAAAPAPAITMPAPAFANAAADERIAIIGLHGQFPGSPDLDAFWDRLSQGRDLLGEVPAERWDAQAWFDADPDKARDGKIYCKRGGFLDDFDKFDAAFFGIAAEDARSIDPQERLFLQSAWSALEDAGYTRERIKRRFPKARSADVGVFAGVTTNSYHLLAPEQALRGNSVAPAAMPWSIANRVSYFFDLQGPSLPVDTACSSSLVALHQACESLRRGECQLAIAGGVNLYLHPSKYQSLCRRRMLATGEACRSYGAGDDGFIPSEAVGSAVLKPLSRAIADDDRILGVIAASACEHGGRANGYAAPNPNSQAALIAQTLRKAGLRADAIGYVEGHGTGTQLGDSLEVAALSQAFQADGVGVQSCALGSVKSNLGHSESAAGITGVAKVLLQFRHRRIAPSLHAREANPNIDFAATPFRVQHELGDWSAADGQPRRALINSFGAGGVNACLVLEEYQAPLAAVADARPRLFLLSARDDSRLRESAARLHKRIAGDSAIDPAALAYTLQTGREAMESRLAIVAADADGLLRELELYARGEASAAALRGRVEAHQRQRSLKPEQRERLLAARAQDDWAALAQAWIEGQALDWDELQDPQPPRPLSLPAYPFARERHWVADDAPASPVVAQAAQAQPAALHPLVATNASTLKEVCFASWLSGEAYYARDHRVDGAMFFPGAGMLEIACVAGSLAGEHSVIALEDVVWNQPLRLAPGRRLVKTLLKAGQDGADYLIVSLDEDNERVVHSEGRIGYGHPRAHGRSAPAPVALAPLVAGARRTLQGADCYRELERAGFQYGPSFRTIRQLHIGDGYALSALKLDDALLGEFDQYLLHPSLIDGALQTVLGVVGDGEAAAPHLPFALGSLRRLRPLTPSCYALARPSATAAGGPADVKQFDIQLLSESGEVLAALNKFYVRALRGAAADADGSAGRVAVAE